MPEAWWEAMDDLGVLRPTAVPHATDYLPGMIDLIGRLIASGHAYEAADGVYFSVDSVEGYGVLAHQTGGANDNDGKFCHTRACGPLSSSDREARPRTCSGAQRAERKRWPAITSRSSA